MFNLSLFKKEIVISLLFDNTNKQNIYQMNVLIFGGAGYIGAHTVLEILDAGHQVVVFDNFSTGEILNVDSRSIIFEGDIQSIKDLLPIL